MQIRRRYFLCTIAIAMTAQANITSTTLRIEGAGLRVVTESVTTSVDLPTTVQTEFGGKQNDDAIALEGVVAVGDLIGPGLETPILLTTAPGHKFQIPGLSQQGVYYLQNVRLMKGAEFLQSASPSTAVITVADLLQTKVTVKQLSPDELRKRGIPIDARNYDVYEYSFTFIIDGKTVTIPFPVVIDPRTHEVQPVKTEQPYSLPPPGLLEPPRWSPPQIIATDFGEDVPLPQPGEEPKERAQKGTRTSIPAAIVIPNSLAVLHQFGWGIGVFDVNAIESNEVPGTSPAGIVRAKEQVSLRAYAEENVSLAFSPESHLLGITNKSAKVYSLDTRKGVFEHVITPPESMDYTGKLELTDAHPRFDALRAALIEAGNDAPVARFNTGALYRNPDTQREYLLIASLDYGLVVVEVGAQPLTEGSFADVVAIPDGATAVRVIDRTNMAAVVDKNGHVLLVDLSRVDERDRVSAPNELFPTVAKALTVPVTQDSRILWRSEEPIAIGNIAPVVDAETGMLIGADMLGRRVRLASVLDPKLRVTVDVGRKQAEVPADQVLPSTIREVGSVVPLGIEAPSGIVQCNVADANCRGSLAAFRVEARLPGSMTESLPGERLAIALESERVQGADMPQTPQPYPVAHLRTKKRDGTPDSRAANGFALKRVLDFAADDVPELRYQKGWNRFASDWIVAIADPRTDCATCKRPAYLASQPNVREIYTTGRFLTVRPELDASSAYGFLAANDRIHKRISTIPADTVRAADVQVAPQAPPVATGLLQETTYVHSGEVETSASDYDAGGRAGWNVIVDRTYRSRTLGLSSLGAGWDSSLFRRLRALPNGDVEYRDGFEVWTFKAKGAEYEAPVGLSLKLVKRDGGWNVLDQKFRIATFDELGRLVSESDEFFKPTDPASGNVIHYAYDAQGRLAAVIDPANRVTTLTYDDASGLLRKVSDWHSAAREIEYLHDSRWRLTDVKLPEVANTSGARPRIAYGYSGTGAKLASITDPGESSARVSFEYDGEDRVRSQRWGTGESATFAYPSSTSTSVTDVLGQQRVYTLTEDRAHVAQMRETAVPVWDGAAFGQLPANVIAGTPLVSPRDRVWKFTYADGMQTGVELDGVTKSTIAYTSAPGVAGKLVSSTTSGPSGVAAQAISWMPSDAPITRALEYQSGPNAGSFLKAITAGSKRVESPEPHRHNAAAVEALNDAIQATAKYEKNGLLQESASSGGTDTASAGSKSKIEYHSESAPKHARFLPHFIHEGDAGARLTTEITYPTESRTVETDPRGVITTTDVDAWQRPTRVFVIKPGDSLALETRYEYDAAGRVASVIERQNGNDVTTTYTYDVMGRRTSTTTNNIATVGQVTTSVAYDLANRRTITTRPGGATATTFVDALGRTIATRLETGGSPIEQKFAYDLAGNRAFSTDLLVATATAYDSHGRAIATRGADGTVTTVKHDEHGQPTEVKALDASATETIAETSYAYSESGRLATMKAKVDASVERATTTVWDGAGRTTGVAVGNRASRSEFDIAGRATFHSIGAGDAKALAEIFTKSEVTAHDGDLPASTESTEKGGAPITTAVQRDTTGGVTQAKSGSLEWKQKYDELGHVTEASAPGRPPAKWDVDARGNVTEETLPDGATNRYAYDGNGALTNYTDPASEATSTVTDLIGRPISRSYADGTGEAIVWQGARLASVTDRQGRTLHYSYNAKGQLEEIRSGITLLDRITYDSAGRMTSWKTPDSELTWSEFDLEGRPKRTTQRRFRDGVLIDEFEQRHAYNEHGERTFASMPVQPGRELGAAWTKGITQQYDAMGNVTSIAREGGAVVMSATYRNAGRPDSRTVFTAGGASFVRNYSYDPTTSQLRGMSVSNAHGVFAGSEVTYDGLQKSSAKLLGIASGERYQHWSYDARSRVAASLYGASATADPAAVVPGRTKEDLTPADFRVAQERVAALDDATRSALAQKQIDTTKIDPPTKSFSEEPGHKIAAMSAGPQARAFAYHGAERIDDGRFTYEFDVKGRLIRATEKATGRVVDYTYSGTNRLIGRRTASEESTFVWDPISDRLIAVFNTADGTPLKQIIHGDAAYDDPLETTTVDGPLYPIYDEAGAGSLQAIVNSAGEVIARNLSKDPYGADDVSLNGAAIDRITVQASQPLDTITISIHAAESLAPSTVASGARLAALDASGTTLHTSSVAPTLADPFTLQWTLTAADWTALTTPSPAALSIAVTNTLRATSWSPDLPILPPPDWALATRPVLTSPHHPLELREPFTSLTTFITSIPAETTATTTLYAIDSLPLLGTPTDISEAIVSARMHAHPFTDGMTGLNYVRNRWFDPTSGTWLSPDPLGYTDSSNLYAFAGGDPVNGRDPTGMVATVSANGNIVGVRPDGTRYKIMAAEAKADPVMVLRMLESDSDLGFYDQERIMRQAGLQIPYSSACRLGEECIGSATKKRAYTHLPRNGVKGYVEGIFIGAAGLPPATREQQITSGGVVIGKAIAEAGTVAFAGTKARAEGGGAAGMPVEEFRAGKLRAQVPVSVVMAPLPERSKRSQYMGPTPGKMSTTGVEVMVRMFNEGNLRVGVQGVEVRTQEGMWITLRNTDMSHIEAAVTYWNRAGYATGPRSDEVYAFMRNPDNYILELSTKNRSDGAQIGETYRPPYKKRR